LHAYIVKRIFLLLVLGISLHGCGSGGGSGSGGQTTGLPIRTLSFDRPTRFTDNSEIFSSQINEYWIYIKTDNTVFSDSDLYYRVFPVDCMPDPVDPSYKVDLNTNGVVSLFNLQKGNIYYLKLRTVVSGAVSDFSYNGVSFNFDNSASSVY
jgi:hypothetical protein